MILVLVVRTPAARGYAVGSEVADVNMNDDGYGIWLGMLGMMDVPSSASSSW